MRWWLFWLAASGCTGEGGGPEPVTEATKDWADSWADLEEQVRKLTNQHRFVGANCGGEAMPGGLTPLESDDLLRAVARLHSQDMAERSFFEHVNPDGDDPFDRIEAIGFAGADPWGENIAFGTPSAEMVVQLWMESPGHCANIMLPEFKVIGVGYFADETDSQSHFWTQNFAGGH